MNAEKYNNHFIVKDNALVVPALDGDFVGDGRSIHGVLKNINDPYYFNHTRGGVTWLNEKAQSKYIKENMNSGSNIPYFKGTWLYVGAYIPAFGHFLSECIHRLWYLKLNDKIKQIEGVILIPSIHQKNMSIDKCPSYVKDLYQFYDKNLKIKFIHELSCFETLIVPEQGSELGYEAKNWYKKMPQNFFYSSSITNISNAQKLIISRKKYFDKGRTLGIDYFWDKMVEDNYKIIFPEEYSLKDQISLIKNAKIIIWEEGSAIHLLELFPYLDLTSKNLFVSRREEITGQYSIIKFLRQKLSILYIFSEVKNLGEKSSKLHNAASIILKPEDFSTFLEENKFINKFLFSSSDFYNYEYKDFLNLSNSSRTSVEYVKEIIQSMWKIRKDII